MFGDTEMLPWQMSPRQALRQA